MSTAERNGRYITGLALIVYIIVSVALLLLIACEIIEFKPEHIFLRTNFICAIMGALGATTAAIRKYYKYLIISSEEEKDNVTSKLSQWSFAWTYYYLTRPILGSLLGALSYLFSYIGVGILSSAEKVDLSAKGIYFLYAFAFLSGFSVSHVLDRLENVSKQIFSKDE